MKQMTKFLADECVFSLTVELLKNTGWDVVTVREVGLQGAKDSEVISKAKEIKIFGVGSLILKYTLVI